MTVNDKPETVAIAAESVTTARNGFGAGPRTLRDLNASYAAENQPRERVEPGKVEFGISVDTNAENVDVVIVNGLRFLPASDVDAMRTRLATVEANAEVLIVARHDLMAAVDDTTLQLAANADWLAGETSGYGPTWSNGPARIDGKGYADQMREAALLLDRLAAYMKGQDERLVAMGDQNEQANYNRLVERERADRAERQLADMTTNRDALAEECFNLNLRDEASTSTIQAMTSRVADLTAERDAAAENARRERERYDELHRTTTLANDAISKAGDEIERLRRIDRSRPRCRVVTSPRFYSEEDHQRAADELSRLILNTNRTGDLGRRCKDYVVTVATALGMRRA